MAAQTTTKTEGLYLHGPKVLELESRDLEAPQPDEIQIAIRSTTICGSDLHYFSHFRNGDITVKEPLCLGHESAGEITALGSEVHKNHPHLQEGQLVAVECGVPCGECDVCKLKRYNICPQLRFRSSGSKFPHYQGTLQKKINHPAQWVHKLPDALDCEIGALLEPLAVAVQAVDKAEKFALPSVHEDCLVFGAGAVGLLCCLAARAAGWKRIVIADIDQQRLLFAVENGFADAAYLVKRPKALDPTNKMAVAKETAEQIARMDWPDTGSRVGRLQVVFECTGVQSCIQTSFYATVSGGAVISIGLGVPVHEIPMSEMMTREVALIPTWRYAACYEKAIDTAIASVTETTNGKRLPDIRKLITHRFEGLQSVSEAFDVALATRDQHGTSVIKAVINF
ncbi:hypothetical protein E8E14_001700 [Neopestalotiopsis sp. 37M]|nr:hypothetical protein E8E14_001700 [Neopestalotiopsis sp. 37M]